MLRKHFGSLVLFVLFLLFAYDSVFAQASRLKRPKLVVGIVVDQMRWDYLYRYYDRYGDGGFKRLLNEGFSCENTFINYLPAFTAVGHSAIYTGSVPAFNGIVGNDWIDQRTGKRWYCTQDDSVETVGASDASGKMSPHNLLVSTITDELRLATNFQSRVVGVSLKDRAAILPAGHAAGAAFWFDDSAGCFITSSYYMKELPAWVKKFNRRDEAARLVSGGWNTLYPLSTYTQSTADQAAWEGKFDGEKAPVFPHNLRRLYREDHGSIRTSPFGNTLTLEFARAAVNGYQLGDGATPDFLAINCASTDYVGHKFGPNSVEEEDTYLRLDRDLASFFTFLDGKLGKGNYLVFLTADHGAAHAVGFMSAHHIPAGVLDTRKIFGELNVELAKQFGVQKLAVSAWNYHVNFDMPKIAAQHLDFEAIKAATVKFLREQPGIQYAVDIDHIGELPVPEPLRTKIVNGFNRERCSPVIMIPFAGWFMGSAKGTTHGNWNPYDTHIPLIFMGEGVDHGVTHATVHITDIAPTVAALLRIQMPNGSVGRVILPVLGER